MNSNYSPQSATHATLLGVIACVVWSSAVLIMSVLANRFGMLRAAGLELLLGGLILLITAFVRGDISSILRHSTRCYFVCGSMWIANLTLAWTAFATAKTSGQLLVTGLINYLWPSLTLLLAIPILGKKSTWWLAPGLLAVTVGIAFGKIATTPDVTLSALLTDFNALSYLCAALDALAWAFYSNFSRKLSNPDGSSPIALYMTTAGVLILGASFIAGPDLNPSRGSWLLLFSWSAVAALSYLFWDIGMRRGNVVTISTTSMLIPLLSTIITAIFSGHGISLSIVISGALVVLGSWICKRGVTD
jgi:drug/metabolite transporter (DMT)-like permease